MAVEGRQIEEQEPIGIIISLGAREQRSPTVWAYVWSDTPERPPVPAKTKAA